MNKIHIHYRPSDGQIFGFENTLQPTPQPDCEIISIIVPDGKHIIPDSKQYKIDITTLELIEKSPKEQADANIPTAFEIRNRIASELQRTDQYMMPDRPMNSDTRNAWVIYRQALRDLSKLATPIEMVNAWPLRPDVETKRG